MTNAPHITDPQTSNRLPWSPLAAQVCLLAVMALGFFVRVEDLRHWREAADVTFFAGKPLLGALDGYYYLDLARHLVESNYNDKPQLHFYPRPNPPPLLSVTAAAVTRLTGRSLDWVCVFMPAVLGTLLALPLYGLGRHFGGRSMGITSALLGLLSPYYVYRSGMGWFDTDCMNVTWSATVILMFLLFGVENRLRRYAYLGGGLIAALLFLWWWRMAETAVYMLALLPLGIAVVFLYRPTKRWEFAGLIVAALLLIGLGIHKREAVKSFAVTQTAGISGQIQFARAESNDPFPAKSTSTSEQERPSFHYIVDATTRSVSIFLLSGLGLAGLMLTRFRRAVILFPLLALAFLGIAYAERFLIFLTPLSALGLGFIVSRIWSLRGRWPRRAQQGNDATEETPTPRAIFAGRYLPPAVAILVAAAFALPSFATLMTGATAWPKIDAGRAAGMAETGKYTGPDSVIWAWWDNAYALNYWARRKTLFDGAMHGGVYSVYNALPLATSNERLAANFMVFYARHSYSGIDRVISASGGNLHSGLALLKDILAAGPNDARALIEQAGLKSAGACTDTDSWLRFLYPPDAPRIYLYLDRLCLTTANCWYWFGTWDTETRTGKIPFYDPFLNADFAGSMIRGERGLCIDTETGLFKTQQGTGRIDHVLIRTSHHRLDRNYGTTTGFSFEMDTIHRFGIAMDSDIAESVFNRLFVRTDKTLEHFKIVLQETPNYQLWEVHGDKIDLHSEQKPGSRSP